MCASRRSPVLLAAKVKSYAMCPSDPWVRSWGLLSGWLCSLGGAVCTGPKVSHGAVPLLPNVPNPQHFRLPISQNKRWLALYAVPAVITMLQTGQVACIRFPHHNSIQGRERNLFQLKWKLHLWCSALTRVVITYVKPKTGLDSIDETKEERQGFFL